MSISGKIVGTLGIAVAGLAATNVVYTLSDSPAFVEAARVDGVYGDWRLKTGPALYDRSEYLFQLGYGYITADGSFTAVTENIGELADVDTGVGVFENILADGSFQRVSCLETPAICRSDHSPFYRSNRVRLSGVSSP